MSTKPFQPSELTFLPANDFSDFCSHKSSVMFESITDGQLKKGWITWWTFFQTSKRMSSFCLNFPSWRSSEYELLTSDMMLKMFSTFLIWWINENILYGLFLFFILIKFLRLLLPCFFNLHERASQSWSRRQRDLGLNPRPTFTYPLYQPFIHLHGPSQASWKWRCMCWCFIHTIGELWLEEP